MNIIKIDSLRKLEALFSLLNLPGKDEELGICLEELIRLEGQKMVYVKEGRYDEAGKARAEELRMINDILDRLEQKRVLKDQQLNVLVKKNTD